MLKNQSRSVLMLFSLTLFLSAALLFWVQPLLAKMILPFLGGSPSVWNTCMMFFQGTLLIGYLYAHGLARTPIKMQVIIHITILLCGIWFLPFAIHSQGLSVNQSPILSLVSLLVVCAALPLIAISSTAPLLQNWFAKTGHPHANDPYFLYSASNAGSLLALLSFPFILEPFFTLTRQGYLWTNGFIMLILLTLLCGITSTKSRDKSIVTESLSSNITLTRKCYWLALSFAPSSLLLGVTTYITTDIASTPLFWVIPLALYILTFILVFARRQLLQQETAQIVQISLLLPLFFIIVKPSYDIPLTIKLLVHLIVFTATAYVCHAQLVKLRPAQERLTTFYVWIAFGGFLGGVFNTLVAPLLFSDTTEYPVVLMLSLFLVIPAFMTRTAVAAVIGLFLVGSSYFADPFYKPTMLTMRNFFGTLRVVNMEGVHYLLHGTTLHGLQIRDPAKQKNVLSYYSMLPKLMANIYAEKPHVNIAILGLGTGTCACLGRQQDTVTFYEINQDVITIAKNPAYFSYLTLCPPMGGIILGDARLKLQQAQSKAYDVMILDAFSSDAIPVHLLTAECIRLYFDKLTDNGLLAINITNRYIDLKKVISALATASDLASVQIEVKRDHKNYIHAATWIILAKKESDLNKLKLDLSVQKLPASDNSYLWTDDYSNIVRSLR